MESHFTSQCGTSHDDRAQERTSSAVIAEADNLLALATEAALSLALREVFGIIVVDQFTLEHAAPNRVSISMSFRSPARYSEALHIEEVKERSSKLDDAALFLERLVCAVLMDLFHAVRIDNGSVDVNSTDQLTCAIHASAMIDVPGSEGN
jgi:hypothetical protein